MPSAADSLPLPSTFRPMITVGTLGGRSPAKVDPRVAAHGGRHLKLLPTAPWSRRRASTNTIAEAGRAPAQLTFTTDSNLGVTLRDCETINVTYYGAFDILGGCKSERANCD